MGLNQLQNTNFIYTPFSQQVKTSQEVCKKARVPCLGFAETAEKVFETGPMGTRKYASFAR